LYKRLNPDVEIEVVNWRLVASGPRPLMMLRTQGEEGRSLSLAHKGERTVYLPERNGFTPCRVYDRYQLPTGVVFPGPAVVEERECTVVIGVNAQASVSDDLNLVITLP
jgi:N-methylhydantoinase A